MLTVAQHGCTKSGGAIEYFEQAEGVRSAEIDNIVRKFTRMEQSSGHLWIISQKVRRIFEIARISLRMQLVYADGSPCLSDRQKLYETLGSGNVMNANTNDSHNERHASSGNI